MAHWLFKSEPSAWSYEKVAGLGAAGTDWSGVRNHTAKLNMQAMKVGEQAFFYHSNEGKEIVGIVEVSKAYRPDPTDPTGKFGMVDIRALRPLPRAVTLEEAKSDKRLAKMALVTHRAVVANMEPKAAGEAAANLAQAMTRTTDEWALHPLALGLSAVAARMPQLSSTSRRESRAVALSSTTSTRRPARQAGTAA